MGGADQDHSRDRPPRSARHPEPPSTLESLLDRAWSEIARGVASARHGFHQPVIATLGRNGLPEARTIVLRAADRRDRSLTFHTDARSPKVAQLETRPECSWLLYDKSRKLQIRAEAVAEILRDGPVFDERWEASSLSARRCYLAPHTPGTHLGDDGPDPNLPKAVRDRVPTAEETRPGRAHFAVIRTRVSAFDVLHLRHDGHERAEYRWDVDDAEAPGISRWLAP